MEIKNLTMYPNILMIVMDQLRYDCVGYAQKYPVKTPNIDRIAEMGTFFENAYSPQPICCPARQCLLTSKRPERDGLLWNYEISLKVPWLTSKGEFWTKELKKRGYHTSYVGKWHVSPEESPVAFGYDTFVDDVEYAKYRSKVYPVHEFQNDFMGEIDPIPVKYSRTHWLADIACEQIKKFSNGGAPWHLRLDFPEPHLPCRPCEEFANIYCKEEIPRWRGFEDSFINKPYIQKQQVYTWGVEKMEWTEWSEVVARYYAIISQVDDAIGRVLNTLEETESLEKTVVIITSDHGDMCGSHHMMDKHYVLYDDVVHVPLIVMWKGELPEGRRESRFVMNCLDIGPTIMELVRANDFPKRDGRSLLPLIKEQRNIEWRHEAISTYNGQQFGLYTQRMIRTEKWKYIWNSTDIDELYDLEEDPGELHNLITKQKYEGMIKDMRKRLYEILSKEGDGLMKTVWIRNQLLGKTKKLIC